MDILIGIVGVIAVFLANFLLGKAIRNKENRQLGSNLEVLSMKGVDFDVKDAKNL